jgi:hypothetical protein
LLTSRDKKRALIDNLFCRTKAKLVWILAFVLAPYTHILSQTTHKTEGKLFIEAVMPRLLEQGLPHSSSPGDALSGGVDLCITVPAFQCCPVDTFLPLSGTENDK